MLSKKKPLGKRILLPLFICFIMITSILGYMSSTNSEKVNYGDYKFIKFNNGWSTYVNNQKIILNSNPIELENYTIKIDLGDLNSAQKIYLSINPKDNLFLGGLESNIFPYLRPKVIISCYEDNEECINLPLKDCKDANKDIKIILVKKDKNSKFYYKDNCLVMQGNKEEVTKMIDGLVLELLFKPLEKA